MPFNENWQNHLTTLEMGLTHLSKTHVPDGPDMVEAISRIEHVAARATALAKSWKSEIPLDADWRTDTGLRAVYRSAGYDYSFNTEGILRDLSLHLGEQSGLGATRGDALRYAVEEGAAKVTWSISGLEKLFHKLDLPVTVESHEVESAVDEVAHAGRVAKPKKFTIESEVKP